MQGEKSPTHHRLGISRHAVMLHIASSHCVARNDAEFFEALTYKKGRHFEPDKLLGLAAKEIRVRNPQPLIGKSKTGK